MSQSLPERGTRFVVLEPPESMPTIDGPDDGIFYKGETVTFEYYTYNSYDGFPMFFFSPRPDGSVVVWIGSYSDTMETMLARWARHFTPV